MIKYFTNNEFDIAVNIFYDVFINEPWNLDWLRMPTIKDYFWDMIHTPKTIAYSYYYNNILCGVCFGSICYCSPIPIYEIKEIFIRRDYQHFGLGSHMLSLIEQDLKNKNITTIKLSTMRTIPAFNYYIKNGYSEITDSVNLLKSF